MMIDDQPTPLTLTVSKAKPRGDRHWLTIPDIGKGVVPSIDRRFAVDSNAVLADSNPYLRLGRHAFEIIANRFWRVAQGRRNRAPQHRLRIVEGKHPLRIAAVEGLHPRHLAHPAGRSNRMLAGLKSIAAHHSQRNTRHLPTT